MRFKSHLPVSALLLLVVVFCVNAYAQLDQGQAPYVVHPNQEVRIASLPSVVADSTSDADVLAASVATAVMDPDICCGRNSALGDQVGSVSKFSLREPGEKFLLRELGERLRGKHSLDSGSPFTVADQYWPGASVNAEAIVGSLLMQRPLLMEWSGHLYVVYGAVFDEYSYDSNANTHVIRKLFLVDTRYSDKRRYISFNRQTDDWSKVTALLSLAITR